MRVQLVIPPFLPGYSHSSRSPAVARSGTLYFPIWLAYGAGGLERAGHEVALLDAPARGWSAERAETEIARFAPDLLVVDIAEPSSTSDLAFAQRLADRAPIALGGIFATANPSVTRAALPEAWIIKGEYDEALPAICDTIANGGTPREIAIPVETLDGRPFVSDVYRRHLDLDAYFYACSRHPFVAILGGRGCPHACSFCRWPRTISGRNYRTRSPEDIVEEFRFIRRELPQVREVFFEDDTFNVSEKVATERCEALAAAGLGLPWSANVRPDASPELLALMRRAGCRLVLAGYESANHEALAAEGKRLGGDEMTRFARATRRVGILVHGCFMLGLPGETEASLEATINLALALDPDTAQFYPYMPVPADAAEATLGPAGRHAYGGDLDPALVTTACAAARRRFYGRFSWLARKGLQSLLSPPELLRNLRAARRFLPALVRE
jgi:radical SAM superfamily enzyme YgiQ (UPF0313 family)